ncbi:hypothetical protein BJY04DRAFT_211840 [Aspergillus karnatakaensis]|uniref:uncharacterized protein n=1 Tax=Aspergillus karnatakaensis TaxID=1810916 RepID=UPI003CCD58E7
METAPLTLAHTHARNAVLETRKSNPVAASEEHDLAAGEFSTAAQTSKDREALRTLHLLEQHHKKLAQILRFQHENPPSAAAVGPASAAAGIMPKTPLEPTKTDTQQHPPKLTGNPRLPKREKSSIASDLASARGIPAHPRRASPASPTLSSQQAGAKMTDGPTKLRTSEARLRGAQTGQRDRANRMPGQKQPWSPPAGSPTDITSQQYVPSDAVNSANRQSITEEGFQRFYSTFGNLISRVSAPLAFAGLPLGLDGANNASAIRKSPAETRVDKQTALPDRSRHSDEPDINRIFSQAALKVINESNGGTGNTAESFYVVPTTGGTVSYAGILTRAEKEARRNSVDEGEDDFVDARETPPSPEMLQGSRHKALMKGRGIGKTRDTDKLTSLQPPKTREELQLENQALRHLSDTLSKRLHMWEVNAQTSSAALQQSIRAFQEHGPQSQSGVSSPTATTSTPAGQAGPSEYDQRIKELEEKLRNQEKDLEQRERENEKLRSINGRYKDRWEKLKEGAKSRRAEGRSAEGSVRDGSAGAAQQPTIAEETEQGQTSNEPAATDNADQA